MADTNNIGELLAGEIKSEIDNLGQLEPGTDEHSKAVESLTKLYKLRIEEIKNEMELDEKRDRRLMDEKQAEKDAEFKEKQAEKDAEFKEKQFEVDNEFRERELTLKESQNYGIIYDLAIGIGVPLLLKLIDTIAYDKWYNRGLIFEKTGSITAHMTKGLVTKMTPKR